MKVFKRKIQIILTILLFVFVGYAYYSLENFSNSDFGCGCSSTCVVYTSTASSKIIGYILLIFSAIITAILFFKFKGLKKLITIPFIGIFIVAFYGNSYYIFNKGACGLSLNEATFFINPKLSIKS